MNWDNFNELWTKVSHVWRHSEHIEYKIAQCLWGNVYNLDIVYLKNCFIFIIFIQVNKTSDIIWTRRLDQGNAWRYAQIFVGQQGNYRFVIEGIVSFKTYFCFEYQSELKLMTCYQNQDRKFVYRRLIFILILIILNFNFNKKKPFN